MQAGGRVAGGSLRLPPEGAPLIIKEIEARSILSKSRIFEYTLNAYGGCQHNCIYCYAKFMKRFTGHREPWGSYVDVKVNAAELLAREVKKKKRAGVWISGVCDAYQPIEKKYELTRKCLAILVDNDWPVTIQTKSPLVLRDLDILKQSQECEVGFTVTTADDRIRKLFEPGAPPVQERVQALKVLHDSGIRTYVMVAPLLPGAEGLADALKGSVDNALIDRYNYHYADFVYRKHGLEWALDEEFFYQTGEALRSAFERAGIPCRMLYSAHETISRRRG